MRCFCAISVFNNEQTRPWSLPLAISYVLGVVYFAGCSVRHYSMTEAGLYTPAGKIKWAQVTAYQLDTAPDGTPALYVQARGGLPWRNRFAMKVAAKDTAALAAYLERYAPAAQLAGA